ncbi:unnamed protein product [Plutella xylostella]|uniref:(diamondback moth) hypothetical protein n=1 Tax=Plutella xylostella TaxID=51655 RepID=A0A8S4DT41_PLUXY|nr:unnamed protein product [Plutella xylostella]
MADASQSLRVAKKIPDNLYELCLTNLVNYLQKSKCHRDDLHSLPDTILMDVYYKMLQEKRLCILGSELAALDTFERLVRCSGAQLRLLQCFQAVIEHGSKLPSELACVYLARCDAPRHRRAYLIQLGLRLGGFLNEAGWYADAERVLMRCIQLCQAQPQTTYCRRLTLECAHRLLNTQSAYCSFPGAAETYALSLQILGLPADTQDAPPEPPRRGCGRGGGMWPRRLTPWRTVTSSKQFQEQKNKKSAEYSALRPAASPNIRYSVFGQFTIRGNTSLHPLVAKPGHVIGPLRLQEPASPSGSVTSSPVEGLRHLLPRVYKEFSALFFVRCDYNAAYTWGMHALRLLHNDTPPKITVEVLRACAKACVVKRRFVRAGSLIRAAVALARRTFGPQHPRLAHALLDYGFYLLNVDSINHSVAVYEEALSCLRRVFGRSSLHVATAQEDLAYALYVLEYSSGRFYKARDHAERAIRIIEMPATHRHVATAQEDLAYALYVLELLSRSCNGK